MARVQPVLTEGEAALVDQMAQLTCTKCTDVVKNAIARLPLVSAADNNRGTRRGP